MPVILKQIRDFGKNYFFVHFYHHITQPDIRQHYTEKNGNIHHHNGTRVSDCIVYMIGCLILTKNIEFRDINKTYRWNIFKNA